MEKFNIFSRMDNDFKNMLDIAGEVIYHNGKKKIALISNTRYLKEFNDKYISTDFNMKRGDYIYYDNKYWMITTQVGTPRHESYKALMRQIEHHIFLNFYYQENKPDKYLLKCPALVSRTSDYNAEYHRITEVIQVISEIHVFIQDTPKTRRVFDLVNKYIAFGNGVYKIIGVSTVNDGIIDITCDYYGIAGKSDFINGIYWDADGAPNGWENAIDDSLYYLEDKPSPPPIIIPDEPLPTAPNGLQTNVGTITATITNKTSTSLGSITVNWQQDPSQSMYRDWIGYKVRLLKDSVEITSIITTGLSYTFNNLDAGDYIVEISILFSTYAEGEGSIPQTSSTITVDEDSQLPLPPDPYYTNVAPMNATAINGNDISDGKVIFTWNKDTNAEQYAGFVGYVLYLYRNDVLENTVELDKNTTSYEWTNLRDGQYYARIRTKFVINGTVKTGTSQTFPTVTVENTGIIW